jgi:hypothetical protein
MVSTHTSSRGISWELGGEDMYISNDNDNDNANANANSNTTQLDYVIVELSVYQKINNTYLIKLPLLLKLLNFLKTILYI